MRYTHSFYMNELMASARCKKNQETNFYLIGLKAYMLISRGEIYALVKELSVFDAVYNHPEDSRSIGVGNKINYSVYIVGEALNIILLQVYYVM